MADNDDGSHYQSSSSSIGWNPEWDDDDKEAAASDADIQNETPDLPLSSIDIAFGGENLIKEEEPVDDIISNNNLNLTTRRADESSGSSDGSDEEDAALIHSQLNLLLANEDKDNSAPIRYQMLGAPTLVYRHNNNNNNNVPSKSKKWPSPFTHAQINMATYLKDRPLGSWFNKDISTKNTSDKKGETYPHSVQRYLSRQFTNSKRSSSSNNASDENDVVMKWHNDHTVRRIIRDDILLHSTISLEVKQHLLENERLKWLEYKIYQWERKEEERKVRRSIRLVDEEMRYAQFLQSEEEDTNVKRERRRSRRRAGKVANASCDAVQPTGIVGYSWEPRQSRANNNSMKDDEKLAGLELPVEEDDDDAPSLTNNNDTTSSISSSSSVSSSVLSSSASSISTYDSVESAFYRWEEQTMDEINKMNGGNENTKTMDLTSVDNDTLNKSKLLSGWVFDGDPTSNSSTTASKNFNQNNSHVTKEMCDSKGHEYQYSLDEVVEMLEKKYGKQQQQPLQELIPPIPHYTIENEDTQEDKVCGASSYGNCIAILKCTCQTCVIDTSKKAGSTVQFALPSFYLAHPIGEDLSFVSIGKIRFPRVDTSSPSADNGSASVDVTGRILQLSVCGKSATTTTHEDICLVARTSTHCSVLIARPKAVKSNSSGTYDCPRAFELTERFRIDLRSSKCTNQPSYLPFHVACDHKTCVSFFTAPSVAILSLGNNDDEFKTSIHHVIIRDRCDIECHDFSSELADISIVEFDSRDRLVLWAAARPVKMPPVSERFFKRGGAKRSLVEGLTGYGHSLYRLDLRDDSSTFVWSPSHEEYMVDGVYSISGIMPDASRDHILWISSTSACKTYALDVRYKKPKVLVSWSLPSLCEDLGAHCSMTGIHGAGVLMSQPLASFVSGNSHPEMFNIKKDPNTSTLGMHQFPTSMPRFQTQSLESSGFVEVSKSQYDTTSIARSTAFALPGVSDDIFNIGVALLELPSLTALSQRRLSQLGYITAPARIVYAFTMTSIGDVYCHCLLACNATENPKGKYFPGLPVGTTAIPVPKLRRHENNKNACGDDIVVELSNTYPIPSSTAIEAGGQKADFQSFEINAMRNMLGAGESRDNNPVAQSNAHFPNSFHDLYNSKQTVTRNFDTLILSNNKRLKSDIYASTDQNNLPRHVELGYYTGLGFDLSAPDALTPANESNAIASNNSIRLQSKHVLVAVQKDREAAMPSKGVGDLGTDLLQRLDFNYFKPDRLKEEETTGFAVKQDGSYSDDDMGSPMML